jgi:hypothetical protein
LRFLGIIFTVLRLEVSIYNDYIKNQFQTTFAGGGGEGGRRGDCAIGLSDFDAQMSGIKIWRAMKF